MFGIAFGDALSVKLKNGIKILVGEVVIMVIELLRQLLYKTCENTV